MDGDEIATGVENLEPMSILLFLATLCLNLLHLFPPGLLSVTYSLVTMGRTLSAQRHATVFCFVSAYHLYFNEINIFVAFVLRGLDALTNEERITNNLDAVATGLGLSGATADVPSANAFARRCRVMRDELTKVSLCYALVEVFSATDAMTFATRLRASDQRSSSEKAASQSGGKSDRSSRHSHRHRDSPDRRPLLEPLAELEIDGKMVSVNYAKNTFATMYAFVTCLLELSCTPCLSLLICFIS